MNEIVKICGITARADIDTSLRHGANALGFNFFRKSLRYVTPEAARKLVAAVPPGVWRVGVFVDSPLEEMLGIAERVGLDTLQLHGDTLPEGAIPEHLRVICALRCHGPAELGAQLDALPDDPHLFALVDAHVPGEFGGTGQQVTEPLLDLIASHPQRERAILAGGLTPENVRGKVERTRPAGVDVASGVESAPGVKEAHLIERFIREARAGWGTHEG